MRRLAKSKLSILVLLCATAPLPCAAQSIDTMALRAHTRFLAADFLEGRGTGTRGEHIAAAYIAAQLMRMGIEPASGNDYFLPVPLKRALIDHTRTTIALHRERYLSERDFVWHTGGRGALRSFSGPLLFVGAIDSAAVRRAPEARGAVVVVSGTLGTATLTFVPALIHAGAAGIVLLAPDSSTFNLYVRSRGDARYFIDAEINDPIWQANLPIVIAGPTLVRAIAPAGAQEPFSRIEGTLSATFEAVIQNVEATNVAGLIRGTNAGLASEYVAFSAHYDHLGISTPDARGDSIYNGFSDNAAGVAMVLAIADVLRQRPPSRSVLLLFFTGEERGLLGSTYYAAYPPVPLNRIAALINLDAGAPPAPPVEWRIAGGAASPLGEIAESALAARSWGATLGHAVPNSDYWPFIARGVSAVFVIPGRRWEGVSEEQQRELQARWDRYHQAGDEWSPDFPFSGLQRYAEAALAIGKAALEK